VRRVSPKQNQEPPTPTHPAQPATTHSRFSTSSPFMSVAQLAGSGPVSLLLPSCTTRGSPSARGSGPDSWLKRRSIILSVGDQLPGMPPLRSLPDRESS
jgi:hypothetical protein